MILISKDRKKEKDAKSLQLPRQSELWGPAHGSPPQAMLTSSSSAPRSF